MFSGSNFLMVPLPVSRDVDVRQKSKMAVAKMKSEFQCRRTQGKQKRQHIEHADARELRWRRDCYFYFRFTSAILIFLW